MGGLGEQERTGPRIYTNHMVKKNMKRRSTKLNLVIKKIRKKNLQKLKLNFLFINSVIRTDNRMLVKLILVKL